MSRGMVKFTDVVRDVSGGNAKLPQSEFQKSGALAVVDQGQDFIAGYTDDLSCQFQSESLPVIVFGDHTRAIKFIDFPFAMGADGVKVLKPTSDCDAKYLFHCLKYADIPSAGYSRHYKFLKELLLFLPSLSEQRRIAAILDKADSLRAKRREAIAKLDQLLQSVFFDAFGDPVTNSKGWVLAGLADVTEFQEGPGILAKDFRESGIPLIRMAGLNAGRVSLKGCNFVDSEMVARKWQHFELIEGDILVLTSASFGNPAVVDAEAAGGIFYTGIIRFKPSTDKVDAHFLKSFLASMWFSRQANAMASGAVIKHFGPTHLRQMKMPVPPLALQNEYVRYAQRIEEMIASFKVSSQLAEQLFESLQKRAFAGML